MNESTDRLTPDALLLDPWSEALRLLGGLLEEAGSYALPEDLYGASGALFRTNWHLRRDAGAPRRWSSRSAGVSAGDPMAVAAEAYGFRLVRGDASQRAEEGSGFDRVRSEGRGVLVSLAGRWSRIGPDDAPPDPSAHGAWVAALPPREPVTIELRIRAIERSIAIGLEDDNRPTLSDEGIFASGAAAFAALAEDLDGPVERFLPESPEEAARLVPEVAAFPGPEAARLSLPISLGRTLHVFGTARRSLAIYLDRAANFIDVNACTFFFRKEGDLLLGAAERILGPVASGGRGGIASGVMEGAFSDERARRKIRKEIRAAATEHRRGMDALRRHLRETGVRSPGPAQEGSATVQP